jgi:hypothetical protein
LTSSFADLTLQIASKKKGAADMTQPTFDFGSCFNTAWEVYKKNLLMLTGAALVASVVSSVSMGILAGPLLAGLMILTLKLIDGEEDAKFEELFNHFDTFKTTFLLCLGWGLAFYVSAAILMIIPLLGPIVVVILSIAFTPFLLFAVTMAAQDKVDFKTASAKSYDLLKSNLWPLLAYTFLATILASIGAIACAIGAVFTLPMLYLMMATAYRECVAAQPAEEIEEVATPEAPEESEPVAVEEPQPEPEPESVETPEEEEEKPKPADKIETPDEEIETEEDEDKKE